MALLETPARNEDLSIPHFSLLGVDGKFWSVEEIKGRNGTLIMFLCNHCPYVAAIIDRIVRDCNDLMINGVGCAAIMSNDVLRSPDDSYDKMKIFAAEHNFSFPYLIDETQEIAKNYGAVCTPDFFGFDAGGYLHYRGRLDSARNESAGADTKRELLEAMIMIKETGVAPIDQYPSIGCTIKWRKDSI